jgi:hypothetical protein
MDDGVSSGIFVVYDLATIEHAHGDICCRRSGILDLPVPSHRTALMPCCFVMNLPSLIKLIVIECIQMTDRNLSVHEARAVTGWNQTSLRRRRRRRDGIESGRY